MVVGPRGELTVRWRPKTDGLASLRGPEPIGYWFDFIAAGNGHEEPTWARA